ncbi:Ferrous iron transport protein B [Dissulfuribacter thermophilus]|uniref:Fe(2+) transporter FeoB n=1 Tax=Dissulfuribacter thermophilus TaxID=1156395 RepID=A0A1B9F683_9BACT|nr:Ferrous iron transport protein B [Dissulfuribacter thermophilus]
MDRLKIGIVGNPNCGKTTLFNLLTGTKQRVGNWPGVTVDKKVGFFKHGPYEIELVDTPGIYSISASSVDEKVARDFVLSHEADLIVNIVDASNLERNLYLTIQLIEMRIPFIIALNMMDVAKAKGMEINIERLSKELGCSIVPLVASKGHGVNELKDKILKSALEKTLPLFNLDIPNEIKDAIFELRQYVGDLALSKGIEPMWLALKVLEDDPDVQAMVGEATKKRAEELKKRIEEKTGEDTDILIASARYNFISRLTKEALTKTTQIKETVSDRIDRIVLNRALGIPIFLCTMYLMFLFTINIGGAFIDFFDILAGAIFVDGLKYMLSTIDTPLWLTTIIADGIGGGIQTMATFIPPYWFYVPFFCPFLKILAIWPVPHLSWTGSCVLSDYLGMPLSLCSWDLDVMYLLSWQPALFKHNGTES